MSSSLSDSPPLPSRHSTPSTFSDESSLELSFDYEVDDEGRLIRVSKGSSKEHNSPPLTPPQSHESPAGQAANASARRSSLSRSESMPGGSSLTPATRPLSRNSSGPVSIPASGQPSRPLGTAASSGGLNGSSRKLGGAQRVRKEEAERQRREIEERIRRSQEETEREQERERLRRAQEEKEKEPKQSPPHGQRPIAGLPSRSNGPGLSRATRSVAFASAAPLVQTINERGVNNREESGGAPEYHQQYRWRTGAEVKSNQYSYLPTSRTASSYNASVTKRSVNTFGPRRVTQEERMRQELEIAEEEALAKATQDHLRRSPTPPYVPEENGFSHLGARQGHHRRRDSDTLRSSVAFPRRPDQSEEEFDQHPRLSPSSRSLGGTTAVQSNTRTRGSPNSLERPKSVASDYAEFDDHFSGKSQASNHNRHLRQQQQQKQQQQQQRKRQQQRAQQEGQEELFFGKKASFTVSKKGYYKLNEIGKGGSSRVFKVMDVSNQIYALKRIPLDKADEETIDGYYNEISLLNRLAGNPHVIRVVNYDVKNFETGRGTLQVVMECGEVDLARLLNDRRRQPLNMLWVAHYWQQILEAVSVVHEERVVHSDLKPANFVLVKGQLKIIDFGIARAIANDTTNIVRENQIGTVNYMSPESIEVPAGMRRLKIGRPSDIWSLGVILYQMIYGHTPFQYLNVLQKMKAIPDVTIPIEFPEFAIPSIPKSKDTTVPPEQLEHLARPVRKDVIRTMQACLSRNQKDRPTIPELLAEEWLAMKEPIPRRLSPGQSIIDMECMEQLLDHAHQSIINGDYETPEARRRGAEHLMKELRRIFLCEEENSANTD